ncbi:MAG: SDR family oxidoreductase [Chlorobiaceae bacterium]|nr:SDR family oxidoreductase [Chlorobiaceae bacterium]NTV60678.1 SDR family oxidoreductase [Chlorobiaceae bacterium]
MKTFKGTVLVAGATGRTGKWIVDSLQRHRISYHLFVRSREKALEMFGPEITDSIRIGSIENEADTRLALEGADAVISAVGGNVRDAGGPPPSAIDRDGVVRLASVARELNIRKFVLVSSLAVTRPDHPLNRHGRVLSMKLEAEDAVRKLFSESGYSYTIIRPGGLLDGPPFSHELIFDTGDRIETGVIRRSDVAEIAVISLFSPEAHNLTFEMIQGNEHPQSSLKHFFSQVSP